MSLEDLVVLCSGNLELESKQKIFKGEVYCLSVLSYSMFSLNYFNKINSSF